MKKKVIIITLVIIAFIYSASYITFKVINGNAGNQNEILDPIKENKEKQIITEDEKDDLKENQEKSKVNDPNIQNEEVKGEPKQETSNNSNISSNNSTSSNNITTPKQEDVPKQNNITPAPSSPTKSCTPKKFYSTFRADEDIKSMNDCNSIAILYKSIYGYIGFSCDYQTDDCGDLYYMLQMIDEFGNEHGYDTIPKPNY